MTQLRANYDGGHAQAAERASLALFVGTSLSVGITALVIESALLRGRPIVLVDPGADPGIPRVEHVPAKAEELLPEVVGILAGS